MPKKIIILSDLHLWGAEDPLYRALLKFNTSKLQSGDQLFIVGDLFDLFIGNKAVFANRFAELIAQFRAFESTGVEVHYIEGNHDFHLEGLFEDCPHVKIYADQMNFEWDGRRFHFNHGDKINWKDFGYQAFRLFTRNLLTQCLIEALPGTWVDRIGTKMSKTSRGYHVAPTDNTVQLFRNYACEQISNGFDFVIMGHSHHLEDIRFRVENHEGQYVNVGYPRKHKKYLELLEGQKFFELKSWDDLLAPLRPSPVNQD